MTEHEVCEVEEREEIEEVICRVVVEGVSVLLTVALVIIAFNWWR